MPRFLRTPLRIAMANSPAFNQTEEALKGGLDLDTDLPEVPDVQISENATKRFPEIAEALDQLRAHAQDIRQFLYTDRVDIATPLRKISQEAREALQAIAREEAGRQDLRIAILAETNAAAEALVAAERAEREKADALITERLNVERKILADQIVQLAAHLSSTTLHLQEQIEALSQQIQPLLPEPPPDEDP
jgi:hypothetical protein